MKFTSLVADTNTGASTAVWEGSGNDVILSSSGNVGIGTTNPSAKLDVNGGIQIGGHILPSSNAQYDIGSAEYKIRHLFLSDNSLWIGDQHKVSIADGKRLNSESVKLIKYHNLLLMQVVILTDLVEQQSFKCNSWCWHFYKY